MRELETFRLPEIRTGFAFIIAILLMAASVGAYFLRPVLVTAGPEVDLSTRTPSEFGDWRERPSPLVQVSLSTGLDPSMNQPYDQTVMREYENSNGDRVFLALAWGERQQQEVKIHRPDLCYAAQGFKVRSIDPAIFRLTSSGVSVAGKHMVAISSSGGEAVAYWIRIGNIFSDNAFESRLHILTQGIQGNILDGILVRASVRVRDEGDAKDQWKLLDQFLNDLVSSSPSDVQRVLLGDSTLRTPLV